MLKYNWNNTVKYIKKEAFTENNVVIFSHFDGDDIIDEYVIYYLEKLVEEKFDIVFVSTCEQMNLNELKKLMLLLKFQS